MKQRVCLIGPASNVHVQRWVRGLCERGYLVSVLSPTAGSPQAVPSLRHIPVYHVPIPAAGASRSSRLLNLLRGWARLPGIVAALKPDLVNLHSLPTPAATPFVSRLPRLVVSPWGSDVVQRDRRKARMYPRLLARAAAITATSQFLADVTATYLQRPRPIDIVPFGVDVARFTPGDSPDAVHIGTLRQLEPIYGIDILLASLPLIGAGLPDLHCSIGGDGSQREALRRQADQLEVASRVAWRGRIAHDDVPAFLRSLAVFVNPSRAESFGVAALEAQSCGVPVVASRVGGLPEVVRDGVTGVLVPPEQPEALATAIVELLSDPQRRAAMAAAGVAHVRERYSWQSSLDDMQAVYARVLGDAP